MHPRARGMNLQCCTTTLNFGSAYAATRQPICASTSCRFPSCRPTPEVSIAGSRWATESELFLTSFFSYLSCLSLDGTLAQWREVRSLTCRVEGCCSPLRVRLTSPNPSKVHTQPSEQSWPTVQVCHIPDPFYPAFRSLTGTASQAAVKTCPAGVFPSRLSTSTAATDVRAVIRTRTVSKIATPRAGPLPQAPHMDPRLDHKM
jgi:hypothetical protein